jgi:caffeoyl-CoA O-methyltransferase
MSGIIPEAIDKYVEEHSSPVSELLSKLEKETVEQTDCPQMLCGRVEGMLLQILIKISGAKKIVEIGTFTGYSALIMAEGLPDDGELITCEVSSKNAEIARRYFEMSPFGDKIRLELRPAINTLRTIDDGSVDFVFIDADKISYALYYEESLRILKPGGLIAADNTLWSGRALDPEDSESQSIALFNTTVKKDNRVEKVMLTVRDGIYLIRKK